MGLEIRTCATASSLWSSISVHSGLVRLRPNEGCGWVRDLVREGETKGEEVSERTYLEGSHAFAKEGPRQRRPREKAMTRMTWPRSSCRCWCLWVECACGGCVVVAGRVGGSSSGNAELSGGLPVSEG